MKDHAPYYAIGETVRVWTQTYGEVLDMWEGYGGYIYLIFAGRDKGNITVREEDISRVTI